MPLSPTADYATSPSSPDYDHDHRAYHWLVYHILLVTRRRRALFESPEVAARVEELLREVASEQGAEVLECDVAPASVTLQVKAPPTLAPQNLVHRLQTDTAHPLKEEFEIVRVTGSVFVRQYMITSIPVPATDTRSFADDVSRR